MSIGLENESVLRITLSERDMLAVGVSENHIPSIEAFQETLLKQKKFQETLNWTGEGLDEVRTITPADRDELIVVVVHKVPRFAACDPSELGESWVGDILTRTTTKTFSDGSLDYIEEGYGHSKGINTWCSARPWCGQTAFTMRKPAGKQGPECVASSELLTGA